MIEPSLSPTKSSNKFLSHIHYMRGFAIICIVFAHILKVPAETVKSETTKWIAISGEVLFHNSTFYFLFISGFLFYYLSDRFELFVYYKKKFTNVVLPYILIASTLSFISISSQIVNHDSTNNEAIRSVFLSVINGSIQIQYWYIPFITVVFLLSPLIFKLPEKSFKLAFLISCILPVFGTRTGITVTFLQFIYFFPVYFIGVYIAKNHDDFIMLINKFKWGLLTIIIVTTLFLIFIRNEKIMLNSFMNVTESVYYIQKISLCFLFLLVFYNLRNVNLKLLNQFAIYSFAIYFLHTVLDYAPLREKLFDYASNLASASLISISILYTITICLSTLVVCMCLKRIFGRYSRYLIGA